LAVFQAQCIEQSQNFEKTSSWALGKVDTDLNQHRTGGRKAKTWDEIAFEIHFFRFSHTAHKINMGDCARAVSQHWSGRFSRNKDQNEPSSGALPLVVVGRPKHSDTLDNFGHEWVFHQKSTVSRIGYNYMDQNDPFHETVPVRTHRDTRILWHF
jgi:hypothetical protein